MKALYSLFLVFALVVTAMLGAGAAGLTTVFAVIIPYAAIAIFLAGFTWKILDWAKSPVPFRIPTTGGQQQSLSWIKQDKLDNPSTNKDTVLRMLLEVLTFRSLFRNQEAAKYDSGAGVDVKVRYLSAKWLWLFALIFHYAFLIIMIRHVKYFADPVPFFVFPFEYLDSFLQIGQPRFYLTDGLILIGLTFLFMRRMMVPSLRYLSLPADYFPLFLIMTIAGSGILMRYFAKVSINDVKTLAVGLASFQPVVPEGIGVIFYVHLFLVCVLLAYFPFSKLMHLGGVFLSPTRNLPNNSRMVRHVNPWNDPNVKAHSYMAYEDDFRDVMHEAGLPLVKKPEGEPKE